MIRLLLLLMAAAALRAQWPADPALNLVICDRPGEQTLPKIATTSDGGCWISWQDNSSGNYDTWLQRLDGDGLPQFAPQGLLVSAHPQASWITDYDLVCDLDDCAIVAINDIRDGDDRDIFVYRISPAGEFLWGEDGLQLSANEGFEPDPRLCVLESGHIAVAWQEETVIHLRRLTPEGEEAWEPATISFSAEFALSIPRLAAGPDDSVYLQWLEAQGSQFWSPKHLRLQRIDSGGGPLWEPPLTLQAAGGFGPQMRPSLLPDGSGGVFSYWYDSRDNTLHAFAQRSTAAGEALWAADGLRFSTSAGELQMEPVAVLARHDFGFPWLECYYRITNADQSQAGLAGQRISDEGQRLWGDGGRLIEPLSAVERNSLRAVRAGDRTLLAWLDYSAGDFVNSFVLGAALDENGEDLWEPARRTLAAVASGKVHLAAGAAGEGRLVACWRDGRSEAAGDLLLQNLNADGSLGPGEDVAVGPQAVRPTALQLSAAPNPFNPATRLHWTQTEAGRTRLSVFDLSGRRVARLFDGQAAGGGQSVRFDASGLASGVYIAVLETPGDRAAQRLLLLK
jgi:hypothetical protein